MTKEEQSLLLYKERPNLIRYLKKLGCSFHDAEEIIQMIQEKILGCDLNIKNTYYFYNAAKHKYINQKKKRRREILTSKSSWFENNLTTNDNFDNDSLLIINSAVKSLPKRTQIAIKMMFWNNKTRKEIAATLGISENGAKNVIQRGKKKIREYLNENK